MSAAWPATIIHRARQQLPDVGAPHSLASNMLLYSQMMATFIRTGNPTHWREREHSALIQPWWRDSQVS